MIITVYKHKVWIDQLSWSLEHQDENNEQITIDTDKLRYTLDGKNWRDLEENHL